MRQKWDSIGLPLCKGLLSSGQYLGSNTSLGLRIAETIHGLYVIGTIVENLKTGLKERLDYESIDSLLLSLLITKNWGVNRKIANDFCLANQDLQNSWEIGNNNRVLKLLDLTENASEDKKIKNYADKLIEEKIN